MSLSVISGQPIAGEPYGELASALQAIGTRVARPRGTILSEQGEQPSGVFVVCKRELRLLLGHRDRQLAYRTVGPGHVLGLPAVITDQPYSLTAKTVEDSELAVVDQRSAMDLLRRRSDLSLEAVRILAEEARRMRKEAGILAGLARLH